MALSPPLAEVLAALRRAYPDGLPDRDYLPLLAALEPEFSERNLAELVAEFIDGETVVVQNDAAAVAGYRRPPDAEVDRVHRHLLAHGYEEEGEADA